MPHAHFWKMKKVESIFGKNADVTKFVCLKCHTVKIKVLKVMYTKSGPKLVAKTYIQKGEEITPVDQDMTETSTDAPSLEDTSSNA